MCLAELDGLALVASWAGLMVLGLVMWRALSAIRIRPTIVIRPGRPFDWTLDLVLPVAAVTIGLAAAAHVLIIELPITAFGTVTPPAVPFTDLGAVAGMILVVATLAAGAALGGSQVRRISILVAGVVVAYAIPFEVYAWAVCVRGSHWAPSAS